MQIDSLLSQPRQDVLKQLPGYLDRFFSESDLPKLVSWAIDQDQISEVSLMVSIKRSDLATPFSEELVYQSDEFP
ncbi:MAG: hypothetical protein C9356_15040 [Oleiphilus sp.]|nr:MAG: hypothetical protein C9356_15040 [Oleiphilus sp.]